MSGLELVDLAPAMRSALTDVYTRARATGQLADKVRARGGTHADVVRLVQAAHEAAGKPVPGLAEVDWWLEESDLEQECDGHPAGPFDRKRRV